MHTITLLGKGELRQCFVKKVQLATYTWTVTTEISVGADLADIPHVNSWADIN